MAGEPSGARYLSHVMFRVEDVNFNRFPGAILIIVFSLVISSGSAFADGKAEVVAAVNWFLDKLGSDTLGKALIIDEFPPHEWHGPTACTVGGRC